MPCSAEELFDTWVDAESVREWMCPDPSVRITGLEWDPAEGATYRIEMDVDGEAVSFRGRFMTVARPERLVFSWASVRTDERETMVSVTIRSVKGGAELHLVHEALPTERSAADHRHGWENILERLRRHMTSKARGR